MQAGDRSGSVTSGKEQSRLRDSLRFRGAEEGDSLDRPITGACCQSPYASLVPGFRAHVSGDVGVSVTGDGNDPV